MGVIRQAVLAGLFASSGFEALRWVNSGAEHASLASKKGVIASLLFSLRLVFGRRT